MELIFNDFYLKSKKWSEFHAQYSLLADTNLGFMQDIIDLINSEFQKLIDREDEKEKYVFSIFSIWDFLKPNLPKFQILSQTGDDLKFMNNIKAFYGTSNGIEASIKKWLEESSTYRNYMQYLKNLREKKKRDVHFWDFLHSYKTFIYPIQFVADAKEHADKNFVILDLKNKKILPPGGDADEDLGLKWIWDAHTRVNSISGAEKLFWNLASNYWRKFSNQNSKFCIYEFPILINIERFEDDNWFRSCATISIGTKDALGSETIKEWTQTIFGEIQNIVAAIVAKQYSRYALSKSIQSSVAAIMSRNGSHNIGSHVLAAVGNDSIDLPDDRILFKYIQHRMDYIAQTTTEIPQWSYSALFIQDMMRRFFMQRHLLNYIVRSEGLEAYEYWKRRDNKNVKHEDGYTSFDNESGRKLIIKVRKQGSDKYVISPYDRIEQNQSTLALAIPGGVIGQQAFFTILENVIRNSAKHEWSVQKKTRPDNLEITVEYTDKAEYDFVVFKIWDNVSDVFRKTGIKENEEKDSLSKTLLPGKFREKCNNRDEVESLPLHQKLNCYLIKSFVNLETGKLSKENWGLAEMKISTGYLNKRSIEEIGREGEEVLFKYDEVSGRPTSASGLIRAIGVQDESKVYRLGFEFSIPKPKELLIIGKDLPPANILNEARKKNVYFEKAEPQSLDYEFVVFQKERYKELKDKNDKFKYWHYPHRLFGVCDDDCQSELDKRIVSINEDELKDFRKEKNWNGDWDRLKLFLYNKWIKKRFPIEDGNRARLYVSTLPGTGGEDSGKSALEILLLLYEDEIYEKFFSKAGKDKYKIAVWNTMNSSCPPINLSGFYNRLSGALGLVGKNKDCFETSYDKLPIVIQRLMLKHDEHIETLPHCHKTNPEQGSVLKPFEFSCNQPCTQIIACENEIPGPNITYKRHGEPNEKNTDDIYYEALSGSQSYFSMLHDPTEGYLKEKFVLKLVENAFISILIIDERAANYYVDSASRVKTRLDNAGINIISSFRYKEKTQKVIERDKGKDENFDVHNFDATYNYIIIHQGVLDKVSVPENTGKVNNYVDEFVECLKSRCDLLVVTSGRGQPDKLYNNLKFLPFSNLESFILKPYHEKILLVQTLNQLIRER